jgi:fumarate reductase subunit D
VLLRFAFTSSAFVLALLVLVAAVLWHIDVFELPGLNVIGIEQSEVGEILIAFLLVIPAFFVDRAVTRQRGHEAQLQAEQLRVLKATMRTVQDIVSNALMSLYMFRTEAEPNVTPQALELFDHIIADTSAKLKALGDLEKVIETDMAMGAGIEYQQPAVKRAVS